MKIKICCVKSITEAEFVIQHGADAIGLVADMPSGPGIINDELIYEISKSFKQKIETFLLTSRINAQEIIEHHASTQTSTIQMVDEIDNQAYQVIADALPGVNLVQVIHIEDDSSYAKAIEKSKYVDYLLLDSGKPSEEIKKLGGTGETHNWEISRAVVKDSNIPVFLAGGLNKNNIIEAINFVRPYGIDLCSGVRTNDALDKNKLIQFMNFVRNK